MAETSETPMMVQYQQLKKQYPDAFLFFRLGDFYEMFYDDAIKASRLLEITLTSRNKNTDHPIPMCGVPHHAVDEYIKTLIDEGYKVAIAEQMEDPKLTKGMVDRQIVRVVTPGTYLSQGSDRGENNYLSAILPIKKGFALAYADLSTGELKTTTVTSFDSLLTEVSQLRSKEILLPDQFDSQWEEQLQALLSFTRSSLKQKVDEKQEKLISDLIVDIKDKKEHDVSKSLLVYIYRTQFQLSSHWQKAQHYEVDHTLHMDYFAKKNLELTTSIRTNQKSGSLLHFLDHTQTAMGSRLLRQWLDRPLIVQSEIEDRLDQVEDLINHFFERESIKEALKGVYDLERLVGKISMGSVNAKELIQLKNSLQQIPAIIENIELLEDEKPDQKIWEWAISNVKALPEVVDLIERSIKDKVTVSVTDGDVIKDGFDDTLDEYRQALKHGKDWLAALQEKERQETGIKNLKIGYNKVFGYYIEITKANLKLLEEGRYTRKQTLTNAERFITPELKEIEEKMETAQNKAVDLEYQLFVQVRDHIKEKVRPLQQLAKGIAQIDVVQNLASISEQEDYVRPHFSNQHELNIQDSRHPVVEETLGRDKFVPNAIKMDEQTNILLITGPNMSGKSTFMRQLGLIVILAQMGSFIPASKATLPIFDQIFTRIGATDDLQAGESTFMVEMMEANRALQQATDQSLLLFDEIGRGTSTYDGIALAQAILEYLSDHLKAKVLFSTHYHELTALDEKLSGLKNIHVGAKEEKGDVIFLHKIFDGAADKSYGIHVAKLAGMPRSLLDNARQILTHLESQKGEEDYQLNLFDLSEPQDLEEKVSEVEEKVLEELKDVVIDDMTPREAFRLLMSWKDQLEEEWNDN